MAAHARDDDDTISGINVTPLVDVVLVLLVVFIVTAKLVVSPTLPIVVPQASHATDTQSSFSLELGADGRVLVSGAKVANDAAIVALARAAVAKDPELRATLRADGAVPHARVIRAIDLLKEAGVTRVAFAVAKGGSPSPLVAEPASSP
jgi:biopolymer transport protein ExbD